MISTLLSNLVKFADDTFKVEPTGLNHTPSSITDFIAPIVNTLLWVVGVASVIMIIISGFLFVTSAGDPGKTKQAKDTLLYAVVGVVIALMSYAIVKFVLKAF